ncbi:uncharacterized protein LOC143901635 isoform X2 [Temnothorax americanus]|uniref:uncharacterized protein LOC143901635 isoform X2 n=1 Tax=Temnothorax americanus TaxID=1964332 RepID=UPI004068DE42
MPTTETKIGELFTSFVLITILHRITKMDIKTNRIRAPNFSQDEKLILISLIKKYKLIIENKRTDAVSVRDKEEAWLKILDEYNQQSNCRPRELGNIKNFWINAKKDAKKLYAKNKRETYLTGGGSSNIVTDVVADAIYEIIGPSIDGLINPFDSDKLTPKSNDVETPSTVINLLDDDMENDDPNHTSVFQHLVKSRELNSWAEYNPQKLKTIISPPLSNARKSIQCKYKRPKKVPVESNSSNEETLNLMETKTALAKLMLKNIEAKQRIETKILKRKLEKEQLAVKLLKIKCRKANRGEPVSSYSDSMLSSESSEEILL